MLRPTYRLFRKMAMFTIANIYLVIIAGGIVRCTGSGMGCPDWPRCFGRWVPPTHVSQLPSNFVEIYSKGGHLSVEFNVYKTWTEYINRLLGVFVGFAIFLTLFYSLSYFYTKRVIFYFSLLAFILVGFQGWLGAKVVASNLAPYMVSIHMIVALVIVAILLYALALANQTSVFKIESGLRFIVLLSCFISIIQILAGTQVRQAVDVVARTFNYEMRNIWTSHLGVVFVYHRVLAYVVVTVNLYLAYKLKLNRVYSIIILAIVTTEVSSGFILTYLAMPSYIQPIHLVFATMLFGVQFYLFAVSRPHTQSFDGLLSSRDNPANIHE